MVIKRHKPWTHCAKSDFVREELNCCCYIHVVDRATKDLSSKTSVTSPRYLGTCNMQIANDCLVLVSSFL